MTEETVQDVVAELQRRNVPATYEYPGFIAVETTCSDSLSFGDLDDTISGSLTDEIGTLIETFDSTIPRDTTDVKAVANFVATTYSGFNQTVKGNRMRVAIDQAQAAFWAAIAKAYPEITTGDMAPGEANVFDLACIKAVESWVASNVPAPSPVVPAESANRRDGNWHKCEALGNAFRVDGGEVLCAPLLVNDDIDFESASALDFFRGFDGQAEVLAFLDGKDGK